MVERRITFFPIENYSFVHFQKFKKTINELFKNEKSLKKAKSF